MNDVKKLLLALGLLFFIGSIQHLY